MMAAGTGMMLNWLDLTPGSGPAFARWHNAEHLPERVALPGFRRGARYRATSATQPRGQSVLIVYEADRPEAFASAAYLARLNDPTPQTRIMVPKLRNVSRMVCRIVDCAGQGLGGWLLVTRLRQAENVTMSALRAGSGVISASLGLSMPNLAAAKDTTREGHMTRAQDNPASGCLVVHLTAARAAGQLAAAIPGLSATDATLYRLEAALDRHDWQPLKPEGTCL